MDLTRRIFISAAPGLIATPALAATATELGLKPDAKADQSAAFRKAIAKAAERGVALFLPGGTYRLSETRIDRPVVILGVPGFTRLVTAEAKNLLTIEAESVTLDGLSFKGLNIPAEAENDLVAARSSPNLTISNCSFGTFAGNGLTLTQCSGRVLHNNVTTIGRTGIFALDSLGLEITGNHVDDIGNNGIQIWTSDQRQDGTVVSGNRIGRVRFDNGGNGQNGNGIVVFRAGNVIVSHNHVSDCAFSGVRNNSARNCQIVNNSLSRLSETAIYVEFAFEGAVVTGNCIDQAANGISITNFDKGGRLAVCANNVIRGITAGGSNPDSAGVGIGAQAETIVTGNVIEQAVYCGIHAGWGPYARNVMVSGNLLRQCAIGIIATVTEGAGPINIAGNMIAQSAKAIIGMDHSTTKTGDLSAAGAEVPAHLTISGNVVSQS